MKNLVIILHTIRDLFVRWLPRLHKKGGYAFLVHARDLSDVYKRFSFFKFFKPQIAKWLIMRMWPIVVSEITGLKSQETGVPIKGWLIGFPMTARQMLEHRKLALKKIIQSVKLAEKMGVEIVGLGALTSSLSKGGLDLLNKSKISITTGHAYTAYIVTQNLFQLVRFFNFDKNKLIIAIVGAAGSVGSTSAQLIAREGYNHLILLDVERKNPAINNLQHHIKNINKSIFIEISHQIQTIKKADFIITATNAPEVVIKPNDLKSGAIVIDDAQPSDVSMDVLNRDDVLVVEGGVIYTSGITANFDFGLWDKNDNFCCLGELLALSSIHWKGHFVVGRANLELVDKISSVANSLGFRLAKFQNKKGVIPKKTLMKITEIQKDKILINYGYY